MGESLEYGNSHQPDDIIKVIRLELQIHMYTYYDIYVSHLFTFGEASEPGRLGCSPLSGSAYFARCE